MTTLASDSVPIPAADGQIGLAVKTTDIDANSGTGTTAPVEGTVNAFVGVSATASGAAVIQLYDNTAASGILIDEIVIPSAGGVDYELPNPVRVQKGIFLHYVSGAGTVTGIIRIG